MPLTSVAISERAPLTWHLGLNRYSRLSDKKALSLTSAHSRRTRISLLPHLASSPQVVTHRLDTHRHRTVIGSDRKAAFLVALLDPSQGALLEGLACRVHTVTERLHQVGDRQANLMGLPVPILLGKAPSAHLASNSLNKLRIRISNRRDPRVHRLVLQ